MKELYVVKEYLGLYRFTRQRRRQSIHCSDTILGKRVEISEYMPGVESGKAPVLFGDFRYYWIVCRSSVTVKPITEKYVTYDQTGYLASEFLDGRLIRREAVKALQIAE